MSPFRDCLLSVTQDGLHVTLTPWPQAAQTEVRALCLFPSCMAHSRIVAQGVCRGNAPMDDDEDDGVALGWPFERDGVATVAIADLADCYVHPHTGGSIAPPPASEAPPAPAADTAAQFKAAAAALAASRRAAQQAMPPDSHQQAKRPRRTGITGIGPLLRHLRASDEQPSDE